MNDNKRNKVKSKTVSPEFNGNSANQALAAITADDKWIFEQFNNGNLAKYEGEYIVVYNQQVVAHNPRHHLAQKKAAKKLPEVPATRFAITYIDMLN